MLAALQARKRSFRSFHPRSPPPTCPVAGTREACRINWHPSGKERQGLEGQKWRYSRETRARRSPHMIDDLITLRSLSLGVAHDEAFLVDTKTTLPSLQLSSTSPAAAPNASRQYSIIYFLLASLSSHGPQCYTCKIPRLHLGADCHTFYSFKTTSPPDHYHPPPAQLHYNFKHSTRSRTSDKPYKTFSASV